MFITVFFVTCACAILLALRDWVKYRRPTLAQKRQVLTKIAKKILLEKWEEAESMLLAIQDGWQKEAILLYIQVLRGTKRDTLALEVVKKASREYPEELLFRIEEGKILLELGFSHDALESFKVALPILRTPSDLQLLAQSYLETGSPERAWEIVEPLLNEKASGHTYAIGGEIQSALNEYTQAVFLYRKAMQLGYRNHGILTDLAIAYRKLGQLDASEALFRKILSKDKSDVAAVLGLGACLEERGNYRKALLFYQASDAWRKKDVRLLLQAGIIALRLKRGELASYAFEEVIQKRGPSPLLLSYRGYSFELEGKWKEAEDTYRQMIDHFPEDPKGYRALAWLFAVGLSSSISPEEGIRFATRVQVLQGDTLSWEILSATFARAGYFDRAREIQEALAEHDRDSKEKTRRQNVLRQLRRCNPLDDQHLLREMVA